MVANSFYFEGNVLSQEKKKENLVKYKLLYTILILLVYFIGKSLPLYMIDLSAYVQRNVDAEALLVQTITGDIFQCSIFALGISPIMISSMVVQIVSSLRKSESKARTSPKKTQHISLAMTLIFAIVQAIAHVGNLQFRVTGQSLFLTQIIAVLEMVAGVMVLMWLITRNKTYGIGGQSAIIFVNILEGIIATLKGHDVVTLIVPVLVSVFVIVVMIIMENTEKRIPVQRISIHNIYADKNYLAIKFNPIGVMPAMFSTAFFMVPQVLITLAAYLMPENNGIMWWQENMTLGKPLGIITYIVILYILTIGFSRVFLNPNEITEQFLKSGDSILNLHAGKETKRYLSRTINRMSFISATVMSLCLGIPMVLQMTGGMDSSLAALPSSVMMLTGIWCNLYREIVAIRDLEAYEPFI